MNRGHGEGRASKTVSQLKRRSTMEAIVFWSHSLQRAHLLSAECGLLKDPAPIKSHLSSIHAFCGLLCAWSHGCFLPATQQFQS